MRYEQRILDTLKAAERPLLHRDLMERIAPDNQYEGFYAIGAALTKLYRAGMVEREKPGRWFEYTYVEKPPIRAGYTWEGEYGPIVVMAVADGYAMCRRPGCIPFIRTVKEIERIRDSE